MASADDLMGELQPASFRGVPFGVLLGESKFGRGIALHEYPFRDTQWAEDLGRATRLFSIQGFLITDSIIYGGGDVSAQREALIGAVETKGTGTLIHPTLGRLQVSVPDQGLVITDRLDAGSFLEFTLSCYEAGERTFPGAAADSGDDSAAAADQIDDAAGSDFIDDVTTAVSYGESVIRMAVGTASSWVGTLVRLAFDATGIFNMVASLPGNFGRYFNGALAGYASNLLASPVPLTLEGLVLTGTQDRAQVVDSAASLISAAAALEPAGVPPAARAAVASLLASIQNPADGIRLLTSLATFYPAIPTGPSVVGQASATMQTAMAALLRRSALAALVRVSATYQPQSEEDANQVRLTVCDALDAEALKAGDTMDDASYSALSGARGTVAADLDARGAQLPPMRQFTFQVPLPSLVIAQQLYQDASRSDQLIAEANPAHPAFMPLTFKALSS